MNKYISLTLLLGVILQGCSTTAPSTYELNQRSGLDVSVDNEDFSPEDQISSDLGSLKKTELTPVSPREPQRRPPRVEKVWVYDQIINEKEWLQGTWIFVEVQEAEWISPEERSK